MMAAPASYEDLPGAIGMSERDARRYRQCMLAGSADECLSLLQRRRAELMVELHEVQRPIDVVDFAIRDLQRGQR